MGSKRTNVKAGYNISWNWGRLLCYAILILYPLRHIGWGLDLWDTGYSYANFRYMGLEHMDSMWLFATYLANAVGNLLTGLPFAGSLVGMNFYTALFVSGLAAAGFWFCTKHLEIPMWIALVGELAAISLCWCPTSLLYNYLTFVLFFACVVLLYLGLIRKRMWYLFVAGCCLGANVLVRFSNLPQAALIVGVWAYALIEGLELEGKKPLKNLERMRSILGYTWKNACRYTLWCLGGYLSALVVLLGYIHIRYGLTAYVEGVLRLFSMTDSATDYKAASMIMGLVGTYVENLYWVFRIGVFIIAGVIIELAVNFLAEAEVLLKWTARLGGEEGVKKAIKAVGYLAEVSLALILVYWLYDRGFCAREYYHYGAILWPGVTFLMLAMGIAVLRILQPRCPRHEKLICGLMLLVILLTSIGSNNKVYPSLNNLFIVAPLTLMECCQFLVSRPKWRWKRMKLNFFSVKCVLVAFLGLFLIQSGLFGTAFVFVEGTGAQQVTATVENNDILKGVRMSPQRAEWLQGISDYVAENHLQGREVILYGEIPSLSYYLQMPSAFNPWSDLRSYSYEAMAEDMRETGEKMEADESRRPVVLVENRYAGYFEKGRSAFEADLAAQPGQEQKMQQAYDKWLLIEQFMEHYGYEKTFSNEKFTIYE